ncbi:MAG: hypothetical protein ACREXR_16470 [Gammaproteobacteria bacterium]
MKTAQLLILLLLGGCENPERHFDSGESMLATPTESLCPASGACHTSMISVLAFPNAFDGREVRVTGYLVPDDSETRIYLDEEAARIGISDRALLLEYNATYPRTKRMFSGPARYVSIIGIFSDGSERKGGVHGGLKEAGVMIPTFPPTAISPVEMNSLGEAARR